ncbi:MAG TPA: competence/damage-inducible protein A [Isosphaeraceae bacterium]|nr:competence/damage-inducible protein A [Isosphaeraceae bacterium]
MRAEIIAIGSELVSGQGLDTNSPWLSQQLGALGIPVAFHTTLGDDLEDHRSAFRAAIDRADLVIMTGGLGPTQDDLTREALAEVAGVPLVEDLASLEAIAAMFARRHRVMTERNRVQALFPRGAEPLPNPIGTAPGIWMRLGRATIACLPGVPSEMKRMFQEQVLPRLRELGAAGRVIVHRKINLFGKGESEIEAQAMDLTVRGRVPEVGITAHDATISFRITAEAATADEARRLIEPTAELIYERFGSLVVGEDSDDVAEALVAQLTRTGSTLATAESCTGGLIAQLITAIAGVSSAYLGGAVTYSNASKTALLGVPAELIAACGAVSPEVAAAMAEGARTRLGASLGISTTGVAGPTGGTPEKPVGLVYLGLSTVAGTQTRRLDIGAERPRDFIQLFAAKAALNWARIVLIGTATP